MYSGRSFIFHMCDRLNFWPSISLVHTFIYITFVFTLGFTFYVFLIGFGALISEKNFFSVFHVIIQLTEKICCIIRKSLNKETALLKEDDYR